MNANILSNPTHFQLKMFFSSNHHELNITQPIKSHEMFLRDVSFFSNSYVHTEKSGTQFENNYNVSIIKHL